jgi:hypothetical protein
MATGLQFYRDDFVEHVPTPQLAWAPTRVDGVAVKGLRSFGNTGGFAALIRAEAGTGVPARKYLGDTSTYVISGAIELRDGRVAGEGCWVYEPAGAVEEPALHAVDAEYLVTAQAPVLERYDRASVDVLDGAWVEQRSARALA